MPHSQSSNRPAVRPPARESAEHLQYEVLFDDLVATAEKSTNKSGNSVAQVLTKMQTERERMIAEATSLTDFRRMFAEVFAEGLRTIIKSRMTSAITNTLETVNPRTNVLIRGIMGWDAFTTIQSYRRGEELGMSEVDAIKAELLAVSLQGQTAIEQAEERAPYERLYEGMIAAVRAEGTTETSPVIEEVLTEMAEQRDLLIGSSTSLEDFRASFATMFCTLLESRVQARTRALGVADDMTDILSGAIPKGLMGALLVLGVQALVHRRVEKRFQDGPEVNIVQIRRAIFEVPFPAEQS